MNFFLSFVLLLVTLTSQASATKHEAGTWLGYFSNHELTSNQSFWFETQLRHNLTQSKMNQTLVRFGVLQTISSTQKIGILGGYVDSDALKEYRLTLQHQITGIPWNLSLRQRLEYRDVEDIDANALRYRLMMRNEKLHLFNQQFIVWNEAFINLTHETWTGNRVFERNRFFLGPKISFDTFHIEVGYLNQFIPRSSENTMEHLLVAYIIF